MTFLDSSAGAENTSPRRSMERTEAHAYQSLSDSAVRQTPQVQPRAMGGGGSRGVTKSPTFWLVLAFLTAFALCIWTIEIAVRLSRLVG